MRAQPLILICKENKLHNSTITCQNNVLFAKTLSYPFCQKSIEILTKTMFFSFLAFIGSRGTIENII